MPYVSIHVDASDVLEDLSDEDLRNELMRRTNRTGRTGKYDDFHIPPQQARYTLEEAADIFRREGRLDLAFKLEEIREDFVGH